MSSAHQASIKIKYRMAENPPPLTGLLKDWQGGNDAALSRLLPLVHDELRRLARQHMKRESPGHTLQATALVNEAFIRLADIRIDYQDRTHFLAMASRTMRRVLVDHARRKNSAKRGGLLASVTLDEGALVAPDNPAILELDLALTRLADVDERLATGVELVFFGGLTYGEAASVQGVSKTALFEDLQLAKAWLKNQMPDRQVPAGDNG